MSANFNEALKQAWAVNLSVDGELSESVTYVPRVGSTRAIYADIVRDVPSTPLEVDRGLANVMVITVQNDSTNGIASTELDAAGGDKLRVSWTQGATPATDGSDDVILGYPIHQSAATITFRIGRM